MNLPPNLPGVYRLYRDGKCVYVGSSVTMRSRVSKHKSMGRKFDEVCWETVAIKSLASVEQETIDMHGPSENILPVCRSPYYGCAPHRKTRVEIFADDVSIIESLKPMVMRMTGMLRVTNSQVCLIAIRAMAKKEKVA